MEALFKKVLEFIGRSEIFPNSNNNPNRPLVQKVLAEEIRSIVNDDGYIVKGSTGQNPKMMSEAIWVAVFNKDITVKASEAGYYLVYLFKSDGTGFYLSLNQSWTGIKENKLDGIRSEDIAIKLSELIRNYIPQKILAEYITMPIDLNVKKIAKGYEVSNILAKYYEVSDLDGTGKLEKDFIRIMNIYDDLVKQLSKSQYLNLIKDNQKWVENSVVLQPFDISLKKKQLRFVEYRKKINRDNVVENVVRTEQETAIITDDQLEKKLKEQKVLGDEAEVLAVKFYQDEIQKIVKEPKKAEELKSNTLRLGRSHVYGYDVMAYDLKALEQGKEIPILVEVKATTSKSGGAPFYMSRNELATAIREKDKYRILRIYDFNSSEPKCVELDLFSETEEVDGKKTIEEYIPDNIQYCPTNYMIKGW